MITFKPVIRNTRNADGKTNIKIRFCFKRQTCYAPTEFYVFPTDFDPKRGIVVGSYPEQGDINSFLGEQIMGLTKKVYAIRNKINYMGKQELLSYLTETRDYGDMVSVLEVLEKEKEKDGNIKYKESFGSTISAIKAFTGAPTLPIPLVTPAWLKRFEAHLLEHGGGINKKKKRTPMSVNGAGVYLRNIRTAYNVAIKNGSADYGTYPFREFKIKKARTAHRVISGDDVRRIAEYETEDPVMAYARDMFVLTFCLIGINMVDLSKLEKIHRDGRIKYTRSKGKHQFDILVHPEAMALIKKHKGKKLLVDVRERYLDNKIALGMINEKLKVIAKDLDIDVSLTTYYARHTWATVASLLDVPNNTISAALGHVPNSITGIYNMFENKKVDVANRQVLDFVFKGKASQKAENSVYL